MSLIDRTLALVGRRAAAPQWPPRRLSLALQGGGSFGAFAWGVLDRLRDEPYWDGGYAANPPLTALAAATRADHILIVQATPATVDHPPTTPAEIARRVERVQFNATLNAELAALRYAKLIGPTPKLRRLRIGRISAQDGVAGLEDESAGNLGWGFLARLRASGRAEAGAWLKQSALSRRGVSPLAARPEGSANPASVGP